MDDIFFFLDSESFAFSFSVNNKDIIIKILVMLGQVGDINLSLKTCTCLEEVVVLGILLDYEQFRKLLDFELRCIPLIHELEASDDTK